MLFTPFDYVRFGAHARWNGRRCEILAGLCVPAHRRLPAESRPMPHCGKQSKTSWRTNKRNRPSTESLKKIAMYESASSAPIVDPPGKSENVSKARPQTGLLKASALQNAILTSAKFSIIATDEKGIIQLFNIGAERMLGYTAAEVVNKISPSDIHDPQEVRARATALSLELAT